MRNQIIFNQIFVFQHSNNHTIPHNGNPIAELENFIHTVRDINDGYLFLFQRGNNVHKDMYLTVGEDRCWLIKDNHSGLPI